MAYIGGGACSMCHKPRKRMASVLGLVLCERCIRAVRKALLCELRYIQQARDNEKGRNNGS